MYQKNVIVEQYQQKGTSSPSTKSPLHDMDHFQIGQTEQEPDMNTFSKETTHLNKLDPRHPNDFKIDDILDEAYTKAGNRAQLNPS